MQISPQESYKILKRAHFCRYGDCFAAKVGEQDADHVRPGVPLDGGAEQVLDPLALPGDGGLRVAR